MSAQCLLSNFTVQDQFLPHICALVTAGAPQAPKISRGRSPKLTPKCLKFALYYIFHLQVSKAVGATAPTAPTLTAKGAPES